MFFSVLKKTPFPSLPPRGKELASTWDWTYRPATSGIRKGVKISNEYRISYIVALKVGAKIAKGIAGIKLR